MNPERWSPKTIDRAFAGVATAAVVAGIFAGFWVLGTPGRQRAIALDRQRLQDLNMMAQSLHQDYQAQQDTFQLPAELDQDDLRIDPLTNQPFEYRRLSANSFELCASFDTDSSTYPFSNRPQPPDTRRWEHPAGRHCFEFDVTEYPGGFYY
jgi:hypothetical protein